MTVGSGWRPSGSSTVPADRQAAGRLRPRGPAAPELEYHPSAALLLMPDGLEFGKLVNDIREHGLVQSIVLHQGRILDGGNCYRARSTPAWSRTSRSGAARARPRTLSSSTCIGGTWPTCSRAAIAVPAKARFDGGSTAGKSSSRWVDRLLAPGVGTKGTKDGASGGGDRQPLYY